MIYQPYKDIPVMPARSLCVVTTQDDTTITASIDGKTVTLATFPQKGAYVIPIPAVNKIKANKPVSVTQGTFSLGSFMAGNGGGGAGEAKVDALRYKGSVPSAEELPASGEVGDMYNVEKDGNNYAWTGTAWDSLGPVLVVQNSPMPGGEDPISTGWAYRMEEDTYESRSAISTLVDKMTTCVSRIGAQESRIGEQEGKISSCTDRVKGVENLLTTAVDSISVIETELQIAQNKIVDLDSRTVRVETSCIDFANNRSNILSSVEDVNSNKQSWDQAASDISSHKNNTTIHITAKERDRWNDSVREDELYDYAVITSRTAVGSEDVVTKWFELAPFRVPAGVLRSISIPCRTTPSDGVGARPLYLRILTRPSYGVWQERGISTNAVQQVVNTTSIWTFANIPIESNIQMAIQPVMEETGSGVDQKFGIRVAACETGEDLSGYAPFSPSGYIRKVADVTFGLVGEEVPKFAAKSDFSALSTTVEDDLRTSCVDYASNRSNIPFKTKMDFGTISGNSTMIVHDDISSFVDNYFNAGNPIATREIWFETGDPVTEVTWPTNVIWTNGEAPTLKANTAYRFVIRLEENNNGWANDGAALRTIASLLYSYPLL